MGVTLGNPWGLLALLAVPALLAIHLLQRRSVVVPVSTLFLLEQLKRDSEGGQRVERLRASLPLWLQLLGVLLLTWLLTDPQWLEKTSVQRIAIVLDGSASMTVAKSAVRKDLPRDLAKLASATIQAEIYLIDSRMTSRPLYHGPGGDGIRTTLEEWTPAGGTHDPAPALRLARNLSGRDGLVLYVTDAATANLPPGVRLYACGRPVDNAGIAGVTVEEANGQLEWRATLRNYSSTPQTRQWQVLAGKQVLATESLTLPAKGMAVQRGVFPPGLDELNLTLSGDAFPMDDTAPLLRPKLKEITVSLPTGTGTADRLYESLFASLPGVRVEPGGSVPVVAYDPLNPQLPGGAAVIFVRDPKPTAPILTGSVLVEKHPLTDGLGWQSLICQDSMKVPLRSEDEPLVWIGDRAVLFLRTAGSGQQLCFNFDINKSNARRLPALVLTLHRWMENFRSQWPAEEWTLSECGQTMGVAVLPAPAPLELTLRRTGQPDTSRPAREAALLRAPDLPGFLEVWQGKTRLLRTASFFADVREADFSGKGTQLDLAGATAAVTRQHSRGDPSWRGWVLALLAVTGFSWWWLGRPVRRAGPNIQTQSPRVTG